MLCRAHCHKVPALRRYSMKLRSTPHSFNIDSGLICNYPDEADVGGGMQAPAKAVPACMTAAPPAHADMNVKGGGRTCLQLVTGLRR